MALAQDTDEMDRPGPRERARTAAAILLPMSLPAALLLAIAVTLDGGEEALAALVGRAPELAPVVMTVAPLASTPQLTAFARDVRGPRAAAAADPSLPVAVLGAAPMTDPGPQSDPDLTLWPLAMQDAPVPPAPMLAGDTLFTLVRSPAPSGPPGPGHLSMLAPGEADALVLDAAAFLSLPAPHRGVDAEPSGRFLTAAEVRPMLQANLGGWVLLRDWEGQDRLYFAGLTSWRCGLSAIRFGINGAPPETTLPLEPCHSDTATPAAHRDLERFPTDIGFDAGQVRSVTVEVTYDDGTTQVQSYARHQVIAAG